LQNWQKKEKKQEMRIAAEKAELEAKKKAKKEANMLRKKNLRLLKCEE